MSTSSIFTVPPSFLSRVTAVFSNHLADRMRAVFTGTTEEIAERLRDPAAVQGLAQDVSDWICIGLIAASANVRAEIGVPTRGAR